MKRIISNISRKTGLLSFEWVMIIYAVLTMLFILFAWRLLDNPYELLLKRIIPVLITFLLCYIYKKIPNRIVYFLRIIFQLYMLIWWYPDTYELNKYLISIIFLHLSNNGYLVVSQQYYSLTIIRKRLLARQ